MSYKYITSLIVISFLSLPMSSIAEDVITVKTIGMDLARDLASHAVISCRAQGYQASAVVVDRSGNVQAALRGDLASRFTLQIAEEKANLVVLGGISSGEFRKARGDIRPELNHIDGLLVLRGGLQISSGGYRVGAIGVSGAPGGDKDEACAAAALKKYNDRIQFAAD
ncbi:MAG: heme-binding protein [Gammaproteobacteria bacterium]|nr:MAG: heme-binding protein [Gammaproteobacteria bacterium]